MKKTKRIKRICRKSYHSENVKVKKYHENKNEKLQQQVQKSFRRRKIQKKKT